MTSNDADRNSGPPSKETVCALLDRIAPGSIVLTIGSLPGSFSNYTHVVEAQAANGSVFRIVIRRYAIFGNYDRGEKTRREFKTLQLLQQNGIPAPSPLYIDETGAMLGIPGIVTGYVPGEHVTSPSDPMSWAGSLARMLARVHRIPCGTAAESFLLDANAEASWFLRSDSMPDYIESYPEGLAVWHQVRSLWPNIEQVPSGLVHIDYWSGNVLWEGSHIAAVVDWEEAAYGDPGIAVAYCRMDIFLLGLREAAEEFLRVYKVEAGGRVANLGFWELAAAVRPMYNPEGWITESPAKERFREFIADARSKFEGSRAG